MRSRLLALLIVSLAFVACSGSPPQAEGPPPADLVLRGGKIVTLDAAQPEVEALAARDGRIVALGSVAEIEPLVGPSTRIIEIGDGLAIPGFIEGHGHFLGMGTSLLQLELRDARTWDDVVAEVSAAVAEAGPGVWILGRGWHQDKWDSVPDDLVQGMPHHGELSTASPDNPVMLQHASGHGAMVNRKAMELSGIDTETPDPDGGIIYRDPAGRATGYLQESAQGLVDVDRETGLAERAVKLASAEALRSGVTSFQDAGSSVEEARLLREMASAGEIGVRLWVMIRDSPEQLRAAFPDLKAHREAGDRFTVGGIKQSIDGALGSRGAWLLEPYSDQPKVSGLELTAIPIIEESAEIALEHGLQLCVHAIGDRANRETLDLFERATADHADGLASLRWRVEHVQHLHPDDLPRFADLGVVASVQGVHCTSDGPWVPERIGDQRAAEGAYLWRALLDSGAVVLNGTDVPVESIDPIANFVSSVTRQMPDGEAFYPEQRMTREEALRSMTLAAAFGAFEEDEKGSLELGKLADIVVLSQDLLTVSEADLASTQVLTTIVGGEVVFEQ